MRKSFLLLLALAGFCVADAKIVLPQMFQSGMVLQRGKPIPIWGKADPKEQVVIRWQKKQYTTVADDQGRWRIDLPKTKAGGPYTLVVDNQELTDVLVGDVWLCSGQSNIDVTIEALDANDQVLFTKHIPAVPLKRNAETTISGPIFTTGSSTIGITLDTDWLPGYEVTF